MVDAQPGEDAGLGEFGMELGGVDVLATGEDCPVQASPVASNTAPVGSAVQASLWPTNASKRVATRPKS